MIDQNNLSITVLIEEKIEKKLFILYYIRTSIFQTFEFRNFERIES